MDKIKVLCIDDEAEARKALCSLLRSRKYVVTTAASGKSGLAFFKKRNFDVVLCDLNMPEMDGLEFLEKAKRIKPDIPIIILSSHGTIPAAVKSIKKGADDFILEPPNIEEIETTMSNAIEKRDLQKRLQESEDSLKMLVENVPDIIYTFNPKGEFIRLSPAVKANLGYKPSELLGKPFFDIVHPEDKARAKAGFLATVQAARGEIRQEDFRMIKKSGEVRYFEVRGQPIIENGRFVRGDGIARDVTARKNIEKELEDKNARLETLLHELSRSRDELQAIMDTYPDGMIMVDHLGRIRTANKGLNDYFGIEFEGMIDRPFEVFLSAIKDCFEDYDEFLKIAEGCCKTHKQFKEKGFDPSHMYEMVVKQIRPKERFIHPVNISVLDRNDVELGKIWIFVDVTSIKKTYEQLQTIVNASPMPVLVSRLSDGTILFANDNLVKLMGYTTGDILGQVTPDFYNFPEDRKKLLKKIERDGRVHNYELQIKKADGTPIWILLSLEMTEIAGEAVLISGLHDINERKRAEEELKRERNFISTILDTVSTLVIVLDREGRIERFNKTCEKVTGYTFEELKGKPFWEKLLLPAELLKVKKILKELTAGQFPIRHENYWLTKDGRLRLISWANTALLNNRGEVEHIIGTGVDITEHRAMEEALVESEQKFRGIVENANDIIHSITPDFHMSYISPNITEVLGYNAADVEGKPMADFIHQDDVAPTLQSYRKIIKTDSKQSGIEFRVKHKDKGWRWLRSSVSPLKDADGKIISLIGIAHDFTNWKKVMEDLEQSNRFLQEAQAQLVQSEKMASLGQLVAGIAHEINTPIGAVNSMQDTLFRTLGKMRKIIESEMPTDCREIPKLESIFKLIDDSNQVIKSGTDRVINIVTRLKSFARLDEADLKSVDIHEGIEDTLVLIHHELKHGITIEKNYGQVPPISCYPSQLNQVFLNLLVNSKQAIKAKGTISIKTFVKSSKVHIIFADDGEGILKKNLNRVFDPGYTTKGIGVGTGLGLSITYNIIKSHRGSIKVDSEAGKGTKFTITLPMNLEDILEQEKNQH